MLKNYFKIAFRNFLAHKTFTVINLLGLAIGISACLILMTIVDYETSYEKFNDNVDNTYRITLERIQEGESLTQSTRTFPGLIYLLQDDVPEIDLISRMYPEDCVFYVEDYNRISEQETYWVDNDFLKMFDIDMIKGDDETALLNTFSAVISETASKRLFGNEDALGKTMFLNEGVNFLITGIFRDYPKNSHMSFDYLLNFETIGALDGYDVVRNLRYNWVCTYFTTKDNSNVEGFDVSFAQLVDKHFPQLKEQNSDIVLKSQPVADIHLHSHLNQEFSANSDIDSVYFLILISVLIVVMAWVNFINLSTARALERAKEIGVRKVLGAVKSQIIQQFIFESTILNFLALFLSVILIETLLPLMFNITGFSINYSSHFNAQFWFIVFGSIGICGILSGLYPAFLLSSFYPALVLKGKFRNSAKGSVIRNGLVVFQFAAATVLITGTFTVYQQITFMRNQNLGFSPEQVVVIKSPRSMINNPEMENYFRRYKTLLGDRPDIKYVSAGNSIPGHEIFQQSDAFTKQGSDADAATVTFLSIEEDYFKLLGIELQAGRLFNYNSPADSGTVILNEAAAINYGFKSAEDAVNGIIENRQDNYSLRVIGVVKNYHQEHLRKAIEPMMYFKGFNYQFGYIPVRISTHNISESIEVLRNNWKTVYPKDPFDYFFLDEYFNTQYEADRQFGLVFGFFSILAVIISCLGLFGLASFSAVQRTKEIGIRKVLGASIPNLIINLSMSFIRLVIIANIIAIPVAWYFMNLWLTDFAYKIELSVWVFFLSGGIALVIALSSVSWQAIKAATANPVESLKYE